MELPNDPVTPLLGIFPKELKTGTETGTCTQMFRAALFTIAKGQKQFKCPPISE